MTWRKDATGETDYAYDALSREIFRSLQDDSEATLAYTAAGDLGTYTDPWAPPTTPMTTPDVSNR
ncbi:hypothetical protein [Streptomyces sp. SID9727]|uniref:hypothetical protein n=1 Tax=Streptomyces sp. SID9727 TaxID=2706114 RepID=UPI001EF2FFF9|nr:hypothetical protein [Streptomyces sp. SID9727]